jgi:hypothetical protein
MENRSLAGRLAGPASISNPIMSAAAGARRCPAGRSVEGLAANAVEPKFNVRVWQSLIFPVE